MNNLLTFFPDKANPLLVGTGREFIEKIGVDTIKNVVISVMMGENLRTQTEPLSRIRISQLSAALSVMFAKGCHEDPRFIEKLSAEAHKLLLESKKSDKRSVWIAQWLIGLTGKSVQNVLRSDPAAFESYLVEFDAAVKQVASSCEKDYGNYRFNFRFPVDESTKKLDEISLDWEGMLRLSTAVGSQTLTIRGSDKSMYGKLFERLILGSVLTVLGYERVDPRINKKTEGVFWLSDADDERECDATLILKPGKIARFDMGFIGIGNPEISKDKLSRFSREVERLGIKSNSVSIIIIDRLPTTKKTIMAANQSGAEIIQMSMQYWPKLLANTLSNRFGESYKLQTLSNDKLESFYKKKLQTVYMPDFLKNVTLSEQ